jgi:hypothetical protein
MALYDELELAFHCYLAIWMKLKDGMTNIKTSCYIGYYHISGIVLYSVNLRYC